MTDWMNESTIRAKERADKNAREMRDMRDIQEGDDMESGIQSQLDQVNKETERLASNLRNLQESLNPVLMKNSYGEKGEEMDKDPNVPIDSPLFLRLGRVVTDLRELNDQVTRLHQRVQL